MWSKILGHQRQIDQLKKVLEAKRLPNAYLFTGLNGIGKRLVAEVFVSAIFCTNSPQSCGTCIPCTKIKAWSHPDVFFIEPSTEKILIEQIRELQQNLQFYPLEGDAKVAIINDADLMTEAAANSLLKTLEEPPQKTHFILITSLPYRLLPTIRSRCQQITFSPLAEGDVVKYLAGQKGFDKETALQIAKISQGSIGAITLLDPEFIEDVLGRLKNLVRSANSADIILAAETWSKENERTTLVIDLFMSFYRDLLLHRGGVLAATSSKIEEIGRLKTAEKIEKDLKAIAAARDALSTTANKQLLFEQLLFNLTN